jgi:hypothetical protein
MARFVAVIVLMDVIVVMVGVLSVIVFMHRELGRRHAGAEDAVGVDVISRHGEGAERVLQLVERQAGVEERAENHVARDAGKTVEVQQPAHGRPVWSGATVARA